MQFYAKNALPELIVASMQLPIAFRHCLHAIRSFQCSSIEQEFAVVRRVSIQCVK